MTDRAAGIAGRGPRGCAVLALAAVVLAPAQAARDPAAEGLACLGVGQAALARQAFTAALGTDPSRAVAVAGLAATHLLGGDAGQSLSSFTTACQLASEAEWPEACLGAAYLADGDHARAAEHLNRALARRPEWGVVRGRLAYALWQQKLLTAALDTARAARTQGDESFAPLVEAAVLLELGDPAHAYRALAPSGIEAEPVAWASVVLPAPLLVAAEPVEVTLGGLGEGVAATSGEEGPLTFIWPKAGGKLTGRVEVQVSTQTPLQYVVIYVDDQFLAVSNVATYRAVWETWRWADGSHRVRVEGYDATGKCTARQEIEVLVTNRKRTTDAAQAAKDAVMGRRLAELCMPQLAPHEGYVLRARAAREMGLWPEALDAAERAFCFWPWEEDVRGALMHAYTSLGVAREAAQEIHVLPHRREVAVTFDDGPHPRLTPFLLQVLERRKLRATFLLVGKQALLYPDLVRQILAAGHEVGSHSHTHQNMAKLSALDVERELVESRWAIAQACGRRVVLFRPPGGHYSDTVRAASARYGFRPVFWTANVCGYAGRPYAEVTAGLLEDLKPGGVVLLHNGEDETPYVVEGLLDRLIAGGYRLGPVGELSGMSEPYFATTSSVGG